MKIVQINTVANGCTGRIANSIMSVAKAKGHTCMFAYGRGAKGDGDYYRISNSLDSNFHGLLTRIFDTTGLHSRCVTRRFLKELDQFQPDVVHLHNLHGYYINYKMLFAYLKQKKIKVVWTLHDCWPYTGHCPYYTYVDCQKWKRGCHQCGQKLHHPTSYIADRSIKNYRDKKEAFLGVEDLTIVTPSEWLKKEVEQSFLGQYSIVHIPNGIARKDFTATDNAFRKEHGLQNKVLVLGVANLWAETKGLHYFLELAEVLPEDYQIVLVGLSAKQKEELPANIIGLEKTENLQQLADIYSSADMFVNPTLEDNFPTTNIEALSCGTPVITFQTGGSPEAVGEGCGVVVEKNVEALKTACVRLGRKTEECSLRCEGYSSVYEEKYAFERYLNVYEGTDK